MNEPTQRKSAAGKRAVILSSLYAQTTGKRPPTLIPTNRRIHHQPTRTTATTPTAHTPGDVEKESDDILDTIPTWMKLAGLAVIVVLVVAIFGSSTPHTTRKAGTTSSTAASSGATATVGGTRIPSDHPKPPVYAQSAYLLDARTGVTLYSSNANARLPILSTTKLMTALVAVEHGNLDQEVTITATIQADLDTQLSPDSSLMGIKEGETYTLRELLDGLLLVSGNDAAIAIADTVSGNVPSFVALMNQRARTLGMSNTHFANPHGLLAPDHYSCAHDMAILGRVSLGNVVLHQISATKELRLAATSGHHAYDLINGNQLLWWFPGVDGGKPGYDGNRNFNQVISCVRNGRHLIGVVLSTIDWWTDMRDLLNWGYNTYRWISPADLVKTQFIPYAAEWGYFVRDKKENTIPTGDGRYYIYTGFTVSGTILAYFDQNGGLPHFGFPTGMPSMKNGTMNQQFEHAAITCNAQAARCHT